MQPAEKEEEKKEKRKTCHFAKAGPIKSLSALPTFRYGELNQ